MDCRIFSVSLAVISLLASSAGTQDNVGQFYPFLKTHADRTPKSLSYLARDWPDREQWRIQARAKMHELLAYDPPGGPKNAQILGRCERTATRECLFVTLWPRNGRPMPFC